MPQEVMEAEPSIHSAAQLSAWDARRFADRSATLEPPSLSYARTSGELESRSEVGVHLPVGAWVERSRSLASDGDAWGTSERRIIETRAARNRLIAYADAVTAKAELARAMDRLEVQTLLEELTQRQRDIGAVPEFELLALRIDRTDAQAAADNAREAFVRATEWLAIEMGRPIASAPELQRRLPLELAPTSLLPGLDPEERLDIRMAQDDLAQQQTLLARFRSGQWLGGLEVGVLQERTDSDEVNNTVELTWRLPFGGEASRRVGVGERTVRESTLQLRSVQQNAERELAEVHRAKALSERRLQQASEALESAEAWMEEQVYRYSGMLVGPHDILRAAARLRQVQSAHIASQRLAFVAAVDAQFVRAIPIQSVISARSIAPMSSADAGH